jgi:hypothetical protein
MELYAWFRSLLIQKVNAKSHEKTPLDMKPSGVFLTK